MVTDDAREVKPQMRPAPGGDDGDRPCGLDRPAAIP